MNSIALYEDWIKKHSGLNYSSDSINYRVNFMNIWGKMGIGDNELLKEGCIPHFSTREFRNRFTPNLNESDDYDEILDTYSLYELNLLKTERSDWFRDNSQIIAMPNYPEGKVVLSKNESFFIISTNTWNIINENWWDNMIEKGKKLAGDVWNTLKQGAQEVYGFLASISNSIVKFATAEPASALAIGFNILAGISAFIPVYGSVAAPILTAIAGGIEIVGGWGKITKGYKAISKVDNPIVKSMAAIKEGAPLIIVGGITMFLGLSDIITCAKSAIPGEAGISKLTKDAAKDLGGKLHHTMLGKAEGQFVTIVEKLVKKKISSPKIAENVTTAAAAIGLVFIVKGVKWALGGLLDLVVEGLSFVGKGIEFLLNAPGKISELIGKISSDGSSTAVKLIGGALKAAVKPITDGMSKAINSYIKPVVEPVTTWLKDLPAQYKLANAEIVKNLKEVPDQPIEIKNTKLEKKEAKITTQDKEAIQKLQKSGKNNESILPFDEWNSLRFV
jgi:hypothetical protein